jgi:hypothetical protein
MSLAPAARGRAKCSESWLGLGLCTVGVALAAILQAAFLDLRADDAYIVARYAEQWHRGHGLVFNPGERVDAFTSPLHVVLMLAIRSVTTHAVRAYQIGAAIVTTVCLVAVSVRCFRDPRRRALYLSLALACPFVAFWTVGGLETPLLLALCLAIAAIASSSDTEAGAATIVLLCALAVLTRYDAVLYAAPIAGVAAWRHRNAHPVRVATALAALAVIGWLAFCRVYYGDVLPTSFYVKGGSLTFDDLAKGIPYTASFLVLSLLWVPFLGGELSRPMRGVHWAVVMGASLELLYGVWAGTRHMMYAYRIFVPYAPAVALVLLRGPIVPDVQAPRLAALTVAALIFNAALGRFLYTESENPNLSLAFVRQDAGNQLHEFSTIGARHTARFLDLVAAQAGDIRRDWATRARSTDRAPRMLVLTGGLLPYLLPDAYTLERLVSFRHACAPDLRLMADYEQVVYPRDAGDAFAAERRRRNAEVVSSYELVVDGVQAHAATIVVEMWYAPAQSDVVLPRRIDEPCTGGQTVERPGLNARVDRPPDRRPGAGAAPGAR